MARAKAKAKCVANEAAANRASTKRGSSFQNLLDTNKVDEDKALVDVRTDEQLRKVSKRQKKGDGASLQTKVVKCMRDNFPNFSEEQLYSKRYNGKTLYGRIMDDKMKEEAEGKDSVKFGKIYFAERRRECGDVDDIEELDVVDDSQT